MKTSLTYVNICKGKIDFLIIIIQSLGKYVYAYTFGKISVSEKQEEVSADYVLCIYYSLFYVHEFIIKKKSHNFTRII